MNNNINNKSILIKSLFITVIVIIFLYTIFPLQAKNPYQILSKIATNKNIITQITHIAQKNQNINKNLDSFIAIEQAAKQLNINLANYTKLKSTFNTQDVIRAIKSQSFSPIKLGLDLNGGTEFNLSIKSVTTNVDQNINQIRNKIINILRNRINKSGLVEPEIIAEGYNRITVKIPVTHENQKNEYKKLIQMSAKLEFKLIHTNNEQLVKQYKNNPNFIQPIGYAIDHSINKNGKKEFLFVKIRPEMTGVHIKNSYVMRDSNTNQPTILLQFNTQGSKLFEQITYNNINKRLAIILDGVIQTTPIIKEKIPGGTARISGIFSKEEANNIATALTCGNLPANIKIDSIFDIAPTLGKETINSGLISGIASLLCISIFMLSYYLVAGIIANIALIINIILIMGIISLLNATLTLAGIAGIILTIGMAVDANVLIYERIREEQQLKSVYNAIKFGYKGAFITIFDSNMTTLLIGLVLCWFGTNTIRGFGIILSIGIVSSVFTSIFITRLLFDIYDYFFKFKKIKMLKLLPTTKIKFTKYKKISIIISLIMILSSFTTILIKHDKIFSTDFTGGAQITFSYKNHIKQDIIDKFLKQHNYNRNNIFYKFSTSEKNKLEIILNKNNNDQINLLSDKNIDNLIKLLEIQFKNEGLINASKTLIGGAVGKEFIFSTIYAIIIAFISMIIYLTIRFKFQYALIAFITLLHDIIICTGILILTNKQISLTVIAALLTIIGYSVNDTIIIFDRIRENMRLYKKINFQSIINLSINQTLSRTIITSLSTLLVVIILFLFGGSSINAFSLVMIVGIIIGTYSSIFIAAPLLHFKSKKTLIDHNYNKII